MRSIKKLVKSIKDKSLSPVEVIESALDQIASKDKGINAFVHVSNDSLKAAQSLNKNSQVNNLELLGVPISIKDMVCVKGMPTTACSNMLKNFIAPYSATLVKKLQAAGAIIVGKNNCDEFAMGSSNETSCFGSVHNPWNRDYVPGGSSGGSAASVASGFVSGSIGTDTGGSIRQPSSFCGVVGLKPTYGRVSRYGVIAFASSLDQAGPIANNVTDTALLARIISGYDPKDTTSLDIPVPHWDEHIDTDIRGLNVGLLETNDLHPEVKAQLNEVKYILKDLGCKFIEIKLEHIKYAISTYYLICTSEASSNLARYDGVKFGNRFDNSMEFIENTRSNGFGKEAKLRILLGAWALTSGYYDDYYLKACKVRTLIKNDFESWFSKCDVILSPVTAGLAFKKDSIKDKLERYWNDCYTVPSNLAGVPSISLPTGMSKNNLPIGIQLIAPHLDEQSLFNFAKAIEDVCQFAPLQ